MFVLISVGWNTVTQVMWHKCLKNVSPSPSSLPLSKDTLISTYLIDRIFLFLLIYFWVCVSIKYCLNLTVSYIYVKSEKIVIRIWSWMLLFILFVKMAFWLLISWLFVHMLEFCGRLCVLKWQTKSLRLLPFSKSCKAYFYTRQYNILYMNCWFI